MSFGTYHVSDKKRTWRIQEVLRACQFASIVHVYRLQMKAAFLFGEDLAQDSKRALRGVIRREIRVENYVAICHGGDEDRADGPKTSVALNLEVGCCWIGQLRWWLALLIPAVFDIREFAQTYTDCTVRRVYHNIPRPSLRPSSRGDRQTLKRMCGGVELAVFRSDCNTFHLIEPDTSGDDPRATCDGTEMRIERLYDRI